MSKTTHLYNINRREKKAITHTVCKLESDLKVSKQKMKLKLRKCRRQHYKNEMRYKSRIRRLLKAQKPVYTKSDASTDAEFAKSSDHEEEYTLEKRLFISSIFSKIFLVATWK